MMMMTTSAPENQGNTVKEILVKMENAFPYADIRRIRLKGYVTTFVIVMHAPNRRRTFS